MQQHTRRSVLTGMLAASAAVGTAGSALALGNTSLNTSPTVRAPNFDYQLTFSEFPVGTGISFDYWENKIAPVVFIRGASIANDGSNPTSPVLFLLGARRLNIVFYSSYLAQSTGFISRLRFDIGYLDRPHAVEVLLHNGENVVLRKRNRGTGIVTFKFHDLPTPINYLQIRTLGDDPDGWGIDNLMFDQPV
jgi:hypothetical protein